MKTTVHTPKYKEICSLLVEQISSGEYSGTDRLPSCKDLAKKLNVSYLTVTNAVRLLKNDGMVSCVQGKGIFIAKKKKRNCSSLVRTGMLMDTKGHLYKSFFVAAAKEFSSKDVYWRPLDDSVVSENLSEEEFVARIEKYASMGIENFIINGHRHFPYKYFNKYAGSFAQITYTIHCDAEAEFLCRDANIIIPDFRKAGHLAAEHLIENGWTNIAFITYEILDEYLRRKYGSSKYTTDSVFLDGAENAMRGQAVDGFSDIIDEHSPGADKKIMEHLSKQRPAFILMGDNRYKRVLDAAGKMNLKLGKDFGIVGLYNTPWAEAWDLSSVSIREEELARLTVQAIIEKWKAKRIQLEPELIIRGSSGEEK